MALKELIFNNFCLGTGFCGLERTDLLTLPTCGRV